ncbi:MAG: methyltransferase domain-containing protein [Kiritimatiellaceae bacterium]|nr:methyltransferase domain-containing protein [Kiritimatiellaceae bacterium]
MNPSPLICPACEKTLTWSGRECRCENGHTFDPAKEGYLNLLLSHQRRSSHPGDDDNMIQARRRFLDSGAFDPLTGLIRQSAILNPQSTILDCGCGEGHFLGALSESRDGQFFGVDISKEAIRCAAKRYKKAKWIVANGMRKLPFADHSMDVILSVLAPRNPDEFVRVLKPDGALILGVPGPNHLIELRSQLTANAGDFEKKADEAAAKCAPHFKETHRELLSYQQTLDAAQLADLIQMTPIFWCSGPEAKASVQRLDQLTVTVSFTLLTLQRPT